MIPKRYELLALVEKHPELSLSAAGQIWTSASGHCRLPVKSLGEAHRLGNLFRWMCGDQSQTPNEPPQ